MFLELEFEELENAFDLELEQVTEISDGGYDRGYAEAMEEIEAEATIQDELLSQVSEALENKVSGYERGKKEGFAEALDKRTDLVVTANGDYTPSEDSTGFKSVSVNLPNKLNQYLNKTLVELIPEDIYGFTEIAGSAFQSWKKLEKVSLPSTVLTIGSMSFYDCSNLKEVLIPNSVTEIKRSAFGNCYALSKVDLGNGLVTLGNEVFKYAQGFETIVLPSSLKTIGSDCFKAAVELKEIIVKAKTPPTLNGLLVSSTARYPDRIIVPIGSGDLYRQATNWSVYADKIIEGDV